MMKLSVAFLLATTALASAQSGFVGQSGLTTGRLPPAGNAVVALSDLETALAGKVNTVNGRSTGQALTGAQIDATSVVEITPIGAANGLPLATHLQYVLTPLNFNAAAGSGGDDTATLQAGLNACAGKAVFHIPPGMTCNHRGLLAPAGTDFVIDGTLFLIAGSNTHCISIEGSNCTVRGSGVIDGNKANNTYHDAGNAYAGGVVTNSQAATFPTLPFTNITVRDLTIQNIVNWPVSIYSADGVLVENTKLLDSNNAPQFVNGTINSIFANNLVENNPDYGFAFYQGCAYGVCVNNVFKNCGTVGILNDTDTPPWGSQPQHDLVISKNDVFNTSVYGVACLNNGAAPFTPAFYAIEISDNVITNSGTANTGNPGGIIVTNTTSSKITGNLIQGGGTPGASWIGINGGGNCSFLDISHNTVANGGSTGCSTSYGIYCFAADSKYHDNFIYDDQATPTLQVGMIGNFVPGDNSYPGNSSYINNFFLGLSEYGFNNNATPNGATIFFAGQNNLTSNSYQFNQLIVENDASTVVNVLNVVANNSNIALAGSNVAGAGTNITAFGTDPNINITYNAKGTGKHFFNGTVYADNGLDPNGSVNVVDTVAGAGNIALNVPGAIGGSVSVVAFGASSGNCDLTLNPEGSGKLILNGTYTTLPFVVAAASFANDAAAEAAGVPVGGVYRNGSVLQVRVS